METFLIESEIAVRKSQALLNNYARTVAIVQLHL